MKKYTLTLLMLLISPACVVAPYDGYWDYGPGYYNRYRPWNPSYSIVRDCVHQARIKYNCPDVAFITSQRRWWSDSNDYELFIDLDVCGISRRYRWAGTIGYRNRFQELERLW